jgi:hypothetical protein
MQTGMPAALSGRAMSIARILVGLDAYQHNQDASVSPRSTAHDRIRIDLGVDLVDRMQPRFDPIAEAAPGERVLDQRGDARERVRGNERAQPLNRIALVVIARRLDQVDVERRNWV